MPNLNVCISIPYSIFILIADQILSSVQAIEKKAACLKKNFVNSSLHTTRDANDIGVRTSDDIRIAELQNIDINCNTSHNKTFSFGLDRVISLH